MTFSWAHPRVEYFKFLYPVSVKFVCRLSLRVLDDSPELYDCVVRIPPYHSSVSVQVAHGTDDSEIDSVHGTGLYIKDVTAVARLTLRHENSVGGRPLARDAQNFRRARF